MKKRDRQLIRQKRLGAQTLFVHGHQAEGFRLAEAAFHLAFEDGDADGEIQKLLSELQPVELNADVTRDHEKTFWKMIKSVRRTERTATNTRAWYAPAALLVLGLLLGGVWGGLSKRKPVATASNQWNQSYGPINAQDGYPRTEWLLPDRSVGWLELSFELPRRVQSIRLLNARNLPYVDRATAHYRIRLFSGTEELDQQEGQFPRSGTKMVWNEHRFEAAQITRVRIEILQHYGTGGGLAEVKVD